MWSFLPAELPTWLVAALGLAAFYLLLDLIAWSAASRRTRDIAAALGASTRGKVRPASRMRTGRIHSVIEPPPEPFISFLVEFRMGAGGPVSALLWPFGLRRQWLAMRGMLVRPPTSELKWDRGRPPDRALGRSHDTALWRRRRLDFLHEDFAVRGANTGAVEHAFGELQGRLGHFTSGVSLQRDGSPQMVVQLETNGMNSEEVKALVLWCVALAKASLRE